MFQSFHPFSGTNRKPTILRLLSLPLPRPLPLSSRVQSRNNRIQFAALTPVMLSLSGPLLGAVVGATAGLLLVIFVIVLAVRLRYRPRSQEDSHDDGGMANLAASGTGASSPRDKSSTLPLSTDSIESFEKNPDIIPHANGRREDPACHTLSLSPLLAHAPLDLVYARGINVARPSHRATCPAR